METTRLNQLINALNEALKTKETPQYNKASDQVVNVLKNTMADIQNDHSEKQSLKNDLEQFRSAAQTFCDRVELGEVRSVKTYETFKRLLEATS